MTMDRSDGGMLYVPTIMCKEDDRRFLCPFLFTRKCAGVKRRPWDLKRSRMFLSGAGLFFCFPGVARVGVICKVSVAISLEKGVIIMITPWREQLPG
jgi:hypothetical protein